MTTNPNENQAEKHSAELAAEQERDQLKAELQLARDWFNNHGHLAYYSLLSDRPTNWEQKAAEQLLVILESVQKQETELAFRK